MAALNMTEAQAARWFAKLPVGDQLEVVESVFGLASYEKFIRRINEEKAEEQSFHSKAATPEVARKIAERREDRLRQSVPKRKKTSNKAKLIQGKYFLFIKDCRNRGVSWEKIAEELRRKRFKVTPRYLKDVFNEALTDYGVTS